jgi:hypothetical protein
MSLFTDHNVASLLVIGGICVYVCIFTISTYLFERNGRNPD